VPCHNLAITYLLLSTPGYADIWVVHLLLSCAASGIRRRVSFRSSMPPGVTLARDGVTLFGSGGQPLACGLRLDRNGEPVTDQGHPLPEGEALHRRQKAA
jgi:hypothetical protein